MAIKTSCIVQYFISIIYQLIQKPALNILP